MGENERCGRPHILVNALAGAVVCRAPLRLKPSRIWESMGENERCGRPHILVNALAGAVVCRALLRLKPSRKWANKGYYERYGGPHCLVNALAGAFVCRAEGRGCGYGGLFPRPFRVFRGLSWGRTIAKKFPGG
jgi:hypothetical protein